MRLALLLTLLPWPALAEPLVAFGQDTGAPAAWLGPENHFVVHGTINGQDVEIGPPNFVDQDGFVTSLGAERRYFYETRPGGWRNAVWRYGLIVVTFKLADSGGNAEVTLLIRNDDFRQHPGPVTYPIVAHRNIEGEEVGLRIHAEWRTDDTFPVEEAEGWTGTLMLIEDSGSPEDDGFLLDGQVGGLIGVESGTDRLVVSFSARVDEVTRD